MNDYVGNLTKRQFVLDQLAMYSGASKAITDGLFILCPFHAEKTPSGRIFTGAHLNVPRFRCYGCGHSASWNELAPLIGLQPLGPVVPKDEYANEAVMSLAEVVEDKTEIIEVWDLPKNKVWRSIPTNLLRKIGAKWCKVKHPEHGWLKPKIYLPVLINGKLRGYIKARTKKHDDYPSYINSPGVWSKTHGLFPYDFSVSVMKKTGTRTIVLVEGPRDALRLLMFGIPAMCILGTQSWTSTKTKVLELSGARRIVLLMDGDDAGIAATEKLRAALYQMFDLKIIKLWAIKGSPYIQFNDQPEPTKAAKEAKVSLWDPGSMPQWIIDKLKTKYFGG